MVRIKKELLFFIVLMFSFICISNANEPQKKLVLKNKKATFYHDRFENRKTSTGEIFSQKKYTAAHHSIPFNTLVKVTNLDNGRSVIVKVNDRCPKKNVIDLSLIAAKRLKMLKSGHIPVSVEVLNDNYIDIWENQDEIFALFDRADYNDSIRNAYFDSIMFAKENKYQESFLFAYYIRLTTVESKEKAKELIQQLPESYKAQTKVVNKSQQKYYHINIGPFISENAANEVLENFKTNYPLAHIFKKKNSE